MPANVTHALYSPGASVTCKATAAVTGKRFVKISTNGTVPNPNVAPAGAGEAVFGVSSNDTPVGGYCMAPSEGVLTVTAGEALTAGDIIQSGANGVAVKHATGIPVGQVLFDATSGADAFVKLNLQLAVSA